MARRPKKNSVTSSAVGVKIDYPSYVPRPRQWFTLLLLYFSLHTILRGLISETAGIDDCDQIVRAQIWSWGYGPQGPLYTWLMKIFLGTFGFNIYSVTALKEILLFAIYSLTYFNTRLLTRSHASAVAAAVVLQFHPSISWESHRELTHSVMASAFVLAAIFCLLNFRGGQWKYYLWFGVFAACGILSKYNYGIFLAAVLLAGISMKEMRPFFLNRKMSVALLLMLALCLPHFGWIWEHRELAFSSMYKFKVEAKQSWGAAASIGLKKWLLDVLAHVGPVVAILFFVFWKAWRKWKLSSPEEKLLWNTLLWIMGSVTSAVIFFKVTGLRDRWLQPLFVWVPILLIALWHEQLTPRRTKAIFILGALVAVVILVVAPGRVYFTEKLKKNEILNTPYRRLATHLAPAVTGTDFIIAEDYKIAGNLRLWFPGKFVTSPDFADLFPKVSGKGVVIWDATEQVQAATPASLTNFVYKVSGQKASGDVWRFQELQKYHQKRWMRWSVVSLE